MYTKEFPELDNINYFKWEMYGKLLELISSNNNNKRGLFFIIKNRNTSININKIYSI